MEGMTLEMILVDLFNSKFTVKMHSYITPVAFDDSSLFGNVNHLFLPLGEELFILLFFI